MLFITDSLGFVFLFTVLNPLPEMWCMFFGHCGDRSPDCRPMSVSPSNSPKNSSGPSRPRCKRKSNTTVPPGAARTTGACCVGRVGVNFDLNQSVSNRSRVCFPLTCPHLLYQSPVLVLR